MPDLDPGAPGGRRQKQKPRKKTIRIILKRETPCRYLPGSPALSACAPRSSVAYAPAGAHGAFALAGRWGLPPPPCSGRGVAGPPARLLRWGDALPARAGRTPAGPARWVVRGPRRADVDAPYSVLSTAPLSPIAADRSRRARPGACPDHPHDQASSLT